MRKDLLEILVCPVTKEPLEVLPDEKRAALNALIEKRKIQNVGGKQVEQVLQEGLITTDGKTIYRIDDDIPIMLAEEGIAAEQLSGS
ncbi:MAG: hypothetical protein JSW67_15545 [Candidatus Latescibacterota bacterium]|nr:MAG: hypothetical protein JSW67_15545 [Candidatus Latescibacterota bacterium]